MSGFSTPGVLSSATLICPNGAAVALMNQGPNPVSIGGAGVTVGTFVYQLPAAMQEPMYLNEPPFNVPDANIYGITTYPAVPASTVNATNTGSGPVSVTISGGTLTSVKVNGVQVGTTAGTYVVPAGQTISITYTVAPTWVWPAPVLAYTAAQGS